jgi:hypothetical protein
MDEISKDSCAVVAAMLLTDGTSTPIHDGTNANAPYT